MTSPLPQAGWAGPSCDYRESTGGSGQVGGLSTAMLPTTSYYLLLTLTNLYYLLLPPTISYSYYQLLLRLTTSYYFILPLLTSTTSCYPYYLLPPTAPTLPQVGGQCTAEQFLSTEPALPGCLNCFCSGLYTT